MIIKAQSFSAVRCLSIILGFTLLLRMPGLNAQPEGNSKSVQSSAKENNERDPEGEVDPSKLNTPVTLPNDDAPQVFFDARNTGFSKDGSQQIFEGDVIAIGAKSLVTADKVVIDEKRKYLVADGHVIILSNGQYITGDRVELWSDTGDLRVTAAMLVVNDGKEADRIAQEILGYSASEIEFEAHRQSRLSEIGKKKELVSKEARRKTKQGLNVPEEVIKDYARLLEQEDLVQKQENPAFAQMAESRRQTLRRRRDFWEQARLASKVNSPTINAAYFRMYGETLERTNGNDLLARDGVWTPCHCEKDEIPAWAFRSSEIAAQPGGYATFKDAILEIKGVPVLYLPWFRVPIKDKRQSGLLPPGFSSDSKSGTVYSQPLFLDLGPDRDVTLKADLFERRGTKFALEGRYLRKKYSGFQLNVEVMRDRVWLAEKSNREELRELYFGGLDAARLDNSTVDQDISATSGREFAHRVARRRTYWEGTRPECLSPDPKIRIACEDKLRSEIRPPNNSTRGMLRWTGQERITDRLSFVSTGEIYADRQYNSDLYVPESFQAGFDTGSGERAIQPVKLQAHLDRRNYYLGLGSYFGDSVRGNDRYEGYQLPAVMKAKSRWLRIGNTGVPIYASTSLDQYRMARIQGERTDPEAKRDFLPSGWWRRLSASVVAPVSAKTAVQVDYFTDMEARHISFDRTSVKSQDGSPQKVADSTIQSLKTGFRFQLPIDGKRLMPSWLGSSSLLEDEGGRYIQHIMNWSMTLSVRPSVVRKGPYGEAYDVVSSKSPRYFMATDSSGSDESIGAEDFLNEYQLLTFATTHRWKVFNEIWTRKVPNAIASKSLVKPPASLSWEEKSRRELLYSMDHPVKSDSDMFSNDQSKWFINRYQLLNTDYIEPVSFQANISYDYLKETKRRKEGRTLANRPWSEGDGGITVSAYNWSLSDTSRYNIYDRIATKHAIGLGPPGFFRSSVSFGYTLEQNALGENEDRQIVYRPAREKTFSFVTSLTDPITTTYTWGQREEKVVQVTEPIPSTNTPEKREEIDVKRYRQKIGLIYGSKSQCWGLGFSREKGLAADERDSTYLLQLSIVFMGQERPVDLSHSMEREIKKS